MKQSSTRVDGVSADAEPKLHSSMAPQDRSHAPQATRLPEAGLGPRKVLETMSPAVTLIGHRRGQDAARR